MNNPKAGACNPALDSWRSEVARGVRDPDERDWLYRCASLEADAALLESLGYPEAAADYRADVLRVVTVARRRSE